MIYIWKTYRGVSHRDPNQPGQRHKIRCTSSSRRKVVALMLKRLKMYRPQFENRIFQGRFSTFWLKTQKEAYCNSGIQFFLYMIISTQKNGNILVWKTKWLWNGTLSSDPVIARRAVNEILMDVNFWMCLRKGHAAAGNQTNKNVVVF